MPVPPDITLYSFAMAAVALALMAFLRFARGRP
jgi:hypothetical protein